MTTVTIQSNKIVLSKFKTTKCYLEPSYGKKQTNFLVNPLKYSSLGTCSQKRRAAAETYEGKPHTNGGPGSTPNTTIYSLYDLGTCFHLFMPQFLYL